MRFINPMASLKYVGGTITVHIAFILVEMWFLHVRRTKGDKDFENC